MNRYLLTFILILFIAPAFAQSFSQYNTGTLFDSFENPAQRAFIPDSSRYYAFNFFIPTVSANTYLTGNAQSALLHFSFFKNYAVSDSSRLQANSNRSNHILANANVYEFMFKVFTNFDGDQEWGISGQTRAEGRGVFTDQLISLFSGVGNFQNGAIYNDILNTHFYYQAYNQLGLTYHERINKQVSFGFKLSALMGIAYNKLDINRSLLGYSSTGQSVMGLQGTYYSSYVPGQLSKHDLIPNFRNPGASLSIGAMLRTQDGFVLQWNIKDLGFIHWSSRSQTYNFAAERPVNANPVAHRQDTVYRSIIKVIENGAFASPGSFTTAVDGRAEFSASRSFLIADNEFFKYTPALILSKELFYQGMDGALVNHFQYHNAVLTLTGAYNDLRLFTLGTQFMIKSPNVDFFVGSDALAQTIRATRAAGKNEDVINQNTPYSGASLYLGFSVKFGGVIEHPLNSSTIPTGERGFFGRLYNRLFKNDRD